MFGVFGVNAQVTTNGGSGLAATYPSLSAAVTALNAATISSPVVITLSGNETAPAGGYNITATGTSTNTITIQGSSSTITAPTPQASGILVDAIFKITGGDWITIQNFTMLENASNTTTAAGTNNMTEFGVALFYATATNGAQNCTIQNNTITLNRTYQNTFGIYSNSTHTATVVTTLATATGTGGGNSGLKIYGNAISNVNLGIVVVGPTAIADANTGIDIGGSSSGTGNTITNFGTTGTFSGYVTVSGTVNGILVRNSNGFNVSYNSITSSNGGVTSGTLNGIQIQAASNAPTATFTNTINNNTLSLTSGVLTGAINGINMPSGSASATSTLNINNNNFTAAGYSAAASGTITFITALSVNKFNTVNGNTFTNITSNTTGSVTFVSHAILVPSGGSMSFSNNSIVTAFNKTGAGGTVTVFSTSASSTATVTSTFNGNNFSNITLTGATAFNGLLVQDGVAAGGPVASIQNNVFNNITTGAGAISVMYSGWQSAGSVTTGNTITNITNASSIIALGVTGSTSTTMNVYGNTIGNISSTGAATVIGIDLASGNLTNLYRNKIYGLTANNAAGIVNGIRIAGGVNNNVYNNIIGGLSAPITSSTSDAIRGINITSTATLATNKVYYNTIYLNATSTGTNFGSSGIFHTYNATATTATLDLRNNIIVNASGANGTGLAVAFRRSASTDLNNYASTSNNNLFFGTSGVYNNGTTTYAFGPFQTLVGTRETASKSQNPTFASTTGANANYLNFANGAINLAGGNAQVIAGYTTDYSGATRDASAPDMGAYEFAQGTISTPTITGFTTPFSPSAPIFLCAAGGSVVTITGTGLDTVSSVLFNGPSGVTLVGTITGQTATSLTVTSPAGVVDGIIRVTNPAGSADSSSSFTTADAPTVGVSSAVTICSGSSTTLTATGANTYAWSPSTGLSASTGASVTANPTTNTTYTVTGTSTAGCTATNTVAVTVSPVASAITITKNPAIACLGGTTTLTATGGTVPVNIPSYAFNASAGTYTPITGTNVGTGAIGDDVGVGNLPIGFTFPYRGQTHTVFSVSSNGLIIVGDTTVGVTGYSGNALSSTANAIAPLWDDNNTTGGSVIYTTTGTAPNRILTVQWTGMHVAGSGSATNPTIDMQVLLYENGNIQFVYGSQSAALSSPTCSIGISGTASTNFISVTPLSPITTSTSSTSTENTGVNTNNLLSGTTFTFTRPAQPAFSWSPSTDLFTDAAATVPYAGQNVTVVYSKSTVERTYTATSTLGSCPISSTVTVTPNALPTIATSGNASICAGGAGASLTATGGVSYTWSPATGLSAANVANPTATPSTTTTYTVTGTDANGCQNTATSVVTVNTPVAITVQPANQTALEDGNASFSVTATGTGLTYQWQSFDGTNWNDISGETAATYAIATAPSTLNGTQYRVIVSGTAPCAPVTSSAATLTVSTVSFTQQPANQTICSNATATFAVTATGAVTSYLWEYSTNGTDWFTAPGDATGSSLVLSGINSSLSGYLFRCKLNGGVLTSNTATLTVYDAVVIGTQPSSQVVCSNAASVVFTSAATGSGVAYQWQVSTNSGASWNNISGATLATYTINTPGVALNGNQYRVVVSGTAPCSPVTSSAAALTVTDVAVAASSTSVCIGQSVTLSATYTGVPNTTSSSWVCATTGSGATAAISGDSAVVTPTAAGTYVYTFTTNGDCSFTRTVTVTVNPLPIISAVTATPAVVCSDANISLAAASVAIANGTVALGAGASTSSSSGSSMFPGSYGGAKTQFIIRASELTALGLTAGNITSLAFEATTAFNGYEGFALNIGQTAATTASMPMITTGLTQVYSGSGTNGAYATTVGVNTLTFSTPFNWDGTSNIVLSFCWAKNPTATSTTSTTVKTDAPGFTCTVYGLKDSTIASTMCPFSAAADFGTSGTGTSRPKFTFAGVKATNLASTYTWSWNTTPAVATATGTTSVTNTSGTATSRTFTATATSAAGCVNSLTTSAVTVNTTIPAPTGTDSTQCGTGTPTCSVAGTGTPGNTFRWYTVATGGTAISGQTGSTLVSPFTVAATTTLYVSEVSADGLCESPRTAVIVTVTSPFAFALSASTATNCSGAASLTPVTIATNGGYDTYSWSNSATVSGNETTGWTFSPTTTTTYTLTATGGGCSTTATVVVTPTALPVVNATVAPSSICVGASSTLTATTNVIGAGNVALGAGASTSATAGGSMFPGTYGGAKTQYIIRASELTAAGLLAGNITSLAFEATTAFNGYEGFALNIGHTTATAAAMPMITTGLTQVFSGSGTNGAYATTIGVNTLTFSTPFNWDGTSNIVLSFCWAKNPTATSTTSTTVRTDNPGFTCTVYGLKDSTIASTMCPFSAAVDFGTSGTGTSRPKFTFAGQTTIQGPGTLAYTWNDPSSTTGNVLTVSPTSTTAYTVSAYNSVTGCTGTATTTVTVFTPPTAPTVTNATQCGARVPLVSVADTNGYTTPTFKWYADETTTTALQNSTSTTYTSSVSATTTFYVSVVSPGGCESPRAAVTTTVIAPATLSVSPAVTVCTGNSTTLTASGAVSYTWTPGATLDATSGASVVATPTATTTYSVTGVDANGCTTAAATVVVTVAPYPTAVTITQGAASVCTNGVMSLTATGGTIGGSGTLSITPTTTEFEGVYRYGYGAGDFRHQLLFTKSELNALGLTTGGNITSIAFNVSSVGSGSSNNYTISLANTSATALTSTFLTGTFTQVYTAATYTAVSGTNLHTFTTPFAWDGSSNVVVNICYTVATIGTTSTLSATTPAALSNVNLKGSSGACTATSGGTTYANRPSVVFTYTTSVPTPMTWSPSDDLYTDASSTIAYTGGNASVVYTKPSTERVYTATAANGACTTTATTTVTPVALPVFTVTDDVTICKGQSVTLEVTGSGQTYVWSTSATTASISVSPLATTTYTVTATDTTTGCQSTQEVVVTVTDPGAINPIGTTVSHIAIPGSSKVFTVATQAGPVYTYQWQLNDGSGWVDLSEDATYSNVTTANLTVSNIDETMTGYQYQCIVTGDAPCAPLTPIVATLTVDNTGIGQQPQSVTVCAPNSTSFSIATTGDEPYGIEWQVSSDNGVNYESLVDGFDAVTGLTFTGVDQLTLEVSGIAVANNGLKFRCLINFYLPSDGATLTVKAPVVASNPANQTVCATGGTATFSTTATGSDLTYAWEVSTNNGASWSAYTGTGATTASISIVNPALSADGTQYRVVVSGNAVCTSVTTDAATLFINNPTITGQPANASILRGNAATFTVVPSAATSYQWQRSTTLNGTYTNVTDATPAGITYTGADSATLTVTTSAATALGSANFYRCVVTNNGCSVTSTGGQLTVIFYCTPAPSSVDGIGITNVTMGDINNTTGAEVGNYGDFTAQSTTAERLSTVNFAITYATGYAYGTKIWIDFNDDADFNDAGEQVYYGLSASDNPTTLSGSFSIPLTAPLGAHRMRIGGSDTDAGVDPCYAGTWATFEDYTININPAPSCSGTPVAGTASAPTSSLCLGGVGTTITLSGYTSGVVGITFQWYSSTNGVDFAPISGETSATLSTGSISADAYYNCVVTCSESGLTATSNTVALTVFNPIVTDSTPAGRCGTGTVTLGATANEGSTINWYAAATGGAVLGTGTSFTTPSISATTTYYAEASTASGLRSQTGLGNTSVPTSTGASSERGIVFTATNNGTIVSAQYYSPTLNVTNNVVVRLVDNTTGTQVGSSVNLSIPQGGTAGFYTMNLNLPVTSGTTYRLLASFSQSVNRISTGANYATAAFNNLGTLGTITSGYDSAISTSSYNYFHNIAAVSVGCASARTAVVATVDALPAATISYAGSPYCSTATTATVTFTGTTGGTYSSTAGLSIDPSTGAIDVAASTPGTYTVTYTMLPTTYCTAQTATTTVVINQALTSAFAYDFATYCTNQGTATPTITGSAGTFTASPAGLSINATTGAITLASSAAGTYTVTNTVTVAGCPNSVSTFEVTINNAVAITSQPASVSQLPGDNTSFTVAATGTGLTYQWEVNSGSGWSALSGETAATLSLTAVTAEMNGYQYRVVVSGAVACTSVTSSVATLTVSTAAIATNPVNFTACSAGANTATFAVTTTGIVDTYQWQVSTNNGVDWTNITNGGIYADADTATLSLSGLTLSDNNKQFRCVLNGVVNSNGATLFVKEAVAITTQPSSATGCSAGSATFTVAATGDGLAYQWQVSTNSGASWSNVASATSATLTLNSLTADMNGNQYQVIVSGAAPCSAVTSTAVTLTVNTAVAIGTQPANTTVCNAANATFTVTATGTSLGYQWEVNTGSGWSALTGETNASLTVAAVTTAMSGYQYRVVVSGAAPCGSVTSNVATLTVSQPVAPIVSSSNLDVCAGVPQLLTVTNTSSTIITSGTGTSSTTGSSSVGALSPNPMQSYYGGTRQQTLYTAAELTALGITNGAILSSVAINLSAVETRTLQNFTVKMKNTSTTNFATSTFETGTTTVRNAASYQPVVGWNTLALDSNFTYTGGSLIVEFTFSNNDNGGLGTNVATYNTTTNTATLYYRSDGESAATVAAATTATYAQTRRNNMQFGVLNNLTTWSPTTGLFTDAAGTVAYTGGVATSVYVKTNTSASYTVTNTSSLGCTNSSVVAVNVLTPSTLSSITQPSVTCSGSQTTFALSGLLPNSTSTVGYTINGTAQTAITGVVADASGNATFTVALPAVNNGRTLAITSLTRTDLTPNCTTAITANNTVVISVQPLVTYYADADGDGFGNNAVTQITCTGAPVGYVTNNTDCDDTDNTKNATYPFYADNDGDGFGTGTAVQLCAVNATTPPTGYSVNNTDCDDNDNTKNATYPFYADTDGDGFGAGTAVQLCAVNATTPPVGYVVNNTDCAPNDGTRSQSYSFYVDADGDGYGAGSLVSVCAVDAVTPPTGYALNNTDCDDANVALFTTYSFYADTDGDGYGAGSLVSVCALDATTPPAGYSLDNKDCAPTDATKWRSTLLYIDNDGDGYDNGNENVCWGATVPTGYSATTLGNDCDDTNPLRNLTNPCETVVTVKMFIEGYYDADAQAMRPVMMNQGVGSSATDVDTVTIELRDATTYELVASASAMLQTNGNAVATFTTAPSGSFYIVVKHRNSLETWSANPVAVGASPSTYDFTTAASQAYGDNMKMLAEGVYGFYSGDINQDGFVEASDFPFLFNDIDNFVEGYHPTDLNGDGFVEASDFPFLFNNIDAFIELLRPY
ncbi:hypothetical protein GCM10022386_25560 [Flavobacterium cheonhonense]|uniref:Ig-like domain-containing protein n=2 Tax=Flavobacterium cheonhonense TaxID=706185 RepID=A0ABP7U9M4_9FLAO